MPVFATPGPISVTLELVVGPTRITASDRADTVVEVRPTNPNREGDVKAADQTRVEFDGGRLLVKTPKPRGIFNKGGSVDVSIELPTGSSVRGDTALGDLDARGRFGEVRFRTATGDLTVERSGPLHLRTAMGNVGVNHVTGTADVLTGSGDLRVEHVDGDAVVKNSNGHTRVGEVTGDLRVKSANGEISVDLARGDVTATTASGSIRVHEVIRGKVVMETSVGQLEVGIRNGTAAWLDLSSVLGAVHNSLEAASGPDPATETVEVRGRTGYGDIVVRRAIPTKEDDS
ncbi:MAG: DUF4097 family beta strand repeat protein [Saccharothrix sp.]|nr:DUF4097 family beta strand repeat protein [Saccharothrix sp.]